MGNAGGAGAGEYRPPITPFAGWVADERTNRLRPLETAPHIGAFAPPGTGKTRKWLAQSAVLWPGPALVSSSKDDLMQMVASRRYGPSALRTDHVVQTLAIRKHRHTQPDGGGPVLVSALVRTNDPQQPQQPPTLFLNPLPGDQYTAALWDAPIARPRLALPTRVLDDPDDLQIPIGPTGIARELASWCWSLVSLE
jgi:hypothetical protein